ncbi:hypothetical protein HHK36_015660 [Tetracentron sinense]|uniref:Pentatricopeptide repeat-containing protein n=1 Tax=Tetracentron sinense TaxID=13715 RepID=A0A834Z5C7_TETSI|nr:hypothetical protein HHK36_015660 [Tetracentron sinense]
MVEESATNAIVNGTVKVILGSVWSDGFEKKLGELKLSLSDNTLSRVIKELRGYPLKALGQDGSIKEFWSMVKEMKIAGHEMDIDTYKALKAFPKEAVKKYLAAGHFLSKALYDGIHRSLANVGRFEAAKKILEAMRNVGYEPDNITYSQMVFGLCKAKRLDEACKILDEMEEQGCVPDLRTWTLFIQEHCTANEVDKALTCLIHKDDGDEL